MKTHSEVQKLLRDHGLGGYPLTEPPKGYIATLIESTTNRTISLRFQSPDRDPAMPGPDMVVITLIQQLFPDAQVTSGELADYTLDYFLENEVKESVVVVPGNKIRYMLKEERKNGKRQDPFNWKYLPETVSLHIARTVPWIIDNDPRTVEANVREARQALSDLSRKFGLEIEDLQERRAVAESTLKALGS